ncbi:hypothetical protein LJC38_00800, partial [Parabacteroides sp. OttesenSCG-928-K15]|nr:hypothetical protein [Parabacteroides sp. OttesenSCG-928-K15]
VQLLENYLHLWIKLNTIWNMKILAKIIGVFLFVVLTACDGDDYTPVDPDNALIGTWLQVSIDDDNQRVYKRVESLDEEDYGIVFKWKNEFLNRTGSSWCGTPPVVMVYNEGVWSEKDSIIDIRVAYWGGKVKMKWQILSLDKTQLIIKILEEETID